MSDSTGNKQRLLIVDDSKVIRVTARKILRDHFETVEAVDGENAWEILNNESSFSVVVSDLTMPNLDGFGLMERIRSSQQPHIQDLPVIVITGSNDSESVKQRASAAGATDFIGKPFDSVHLLARTQAHANSKAVTRSLTEKMIELEDQALVDPLTGLANEAAFMERGYQQLSYAIRHDTSLSIFRIGIDHYGTLYKRHGEEITEAAIKSVAGILQDSIREEDLVARTGTAHFSLLLPGISSSGIRNLAGRISRDLDGRILKQADKRVDLSVSIGIVTPTIRRGTRFDELLKLANKRLFKAIKQGGNQVVYEDGDTAAANAAGAAAPDAASVSAREKLAAAIAQSIDSGAELEEIVLTAPDTTPGLETDPWGNSTGVENRAPEPVERPSSLFGGPVPDTPPRNSFTGADTAATVPADTSPPSVSGTAGTYSGKAIFTIDDLADGAEEENILITTPPDTPETPEPHTAASPGTGPHTTAANEVQQADAPQAPADGPPVSVTTGKTDRSIGLLEAEAPREKTGLFRRMLRGIGRLFGG